MLAKNSILAFVLLVQFMNVDRFYCHMEMRFPPPRKSKYHPDLKWYEVDYGMSAPIGNENQYDYSFPCKGLEKGPISGSFYPGDTISVEMIDGGSVHDGGHCEYSLTNYKEEQFVVLETIIDNCMIDTLFYDIKLPDRISPGDYVFVWTWIPYEGVREFYMNCADINIKSNGFNNQTRRRNAITGPEMFVGNLPDYPVIPRFYEGGNGIEYYQNRPNVTIY